MSSVDGQCGRFSCLPVSLSTPRLARHLTCVLLSLTMLLAAGCGSAALRGIPAGSIVGRPNLYDYSPSAIEGSNGEIQVWWCGFAANPNDGTQTSDTIQYSTIDPLNGEVSKPQTVLGETPGSWDSAYTCNPQVVGGVFVNPLGDGQTYSLAMYYVGTAEESGFANSIGVAFSNDGVHWKKYPQPVLSYRNAEAYGVGQPAPYNVDGKAGIRLFYEDSNTRTIHKEALSTDGIHFRVAGTLTRKGLGARHTSWGDIAYDSKTGYWYAVFNEQLRPQSSTGNIEERGQMGVTLFRIPTDSLFTGATPWEEVHSFDSNQTGYESNFIAGFLRDQYGNLNVGSYPTIELLTSISNPSPAWNATAAQVAISAQPAAWDVGVNKWTPGQPLMALNRYYNGKTHHVTTGYIDPKGGFNLEMTVAHLYEAPQNGANVALYACKSGAIDFFVSSNAQCEGQRIIGIEGFAWSQAPQGTPSVPLYRCSTGQDHYVSSDANCEGHGTREKRLGYAQP